MSQDWVKNIVHVLLCPVIDFFTIKQDLASNRTWIETWSLVVISWGYLIPGTCSGLPTVDVKGHCCSRGCPMWIMVNTTVMCFRVLSVIRCYSCFLHLELYVFGWWYGSVPCWFHSSLLVVIGLHVQYNNAFHFFPLHLWFFILFQLCFYITVYIFNGLLCMKVPFWCLFAMACFPWRRFIHLDGWYPFYGQVSSATHTCLG